MNPLPYLRLTKAFADIEEASLKKIARTYTCKLYPANFLFVEQDRKAGRVGLIAEGSAQMVMRDERDREHMVGILNPGEFMADISLFVGHAALTSIISREPLVGLIQQRADFFKMLEAFPALKDFFYRHTMQTAWQYYQSNRRCRDFVTAQSKTPEQIPGTVKKSIELIDRFYSDPLTLGAVAKESGMSRYYLSRVFKRYTGCSFKEYLNRKRIEAAKTLMQRKNLNVSEAGFTVGYNDLSYFSRTFKAFEGVSPSEFRKSLKGSRERVIPGVFHSADFRKKV